MHSPTYILDIHTPTHTQQSSTAPSPPPPSHSGSLGDLGLTGSAIKEEKKTSSKPKVVTNVHGIIRNVIQDASSEIGSGGPQVRIMCATASIVYVHILRLKLIFLVTLIMVVTSSHFSGKLKVSDVTVDVFKKLTLFKKITLNFDIIN